MYTQYLNKTNGQSYDKRSNENKYFDMEGNLEGVLRMPSVLFPLDFCFCARKQ
jgi:hypothetical protein